MYVNEYIKRTERVFPMQGRRNYLRCDMNENPEGLPQEFVNKILKEITPEFLATYPEPNYFHETFANYLNVSVEQVLATNGSDMAIRYIFETFGEIGKNVVTVSPSFEMYRINCNILGFHHVPVLYNDDLTLSIENILTAINEDTRIVVLLNPNNPVGDVYSRNEAEDIIKRANEFGALVVIDEAYHYFYEKTFLDFVTTYNNVVILRTFSKLFSIPACRLGVVISSREIISYLKHGKTTFDVNSIALLFGERILENSQLIDSLITTEKDGKSYLLKEISDHGYKFKKCKGNYVLIEPNHDACEVARRLQKEKYVLVHAYSNPLLSKFIRVTTGSKNIMARFMKAFLEVDSCDTF